MQWKDRLALSILQEKVKEKLLNIDGLITRARFHDYKSTIISIYQHFYFHAMIPD